jgi:hypothetical protein
MLIYAPLVKSKTRLRSKGFYGISVNGMQFDKIYLRNDSLVESGPKGEGEVDWRLPYHLRSAVQRPSVLEYVEPG